MFDHPILPTTIVGSYPQPDWLIDRERLKTSLPPRVRAETLWRIAEPWLADAQEAATLMAIRDQEELGIDIVGDGEMRRESYSNRLATALSGIDPEKHGTAIDRTGKANPVPLVSGPIRRVAPIEAQDAAFLRRHSTKPVKLTLPGPFTMTQQAENGWYPDARSLAMDYADAVNAEVRDLFAAGVDVVQLDEPYLQARADEAQHYAIEAINRALDGVEGTTALHICFGYAMVHHGAGSAGAKPQAYDFLAELEASAIDVISIEAAQPGLDPAILAELPTKTIMYGVLDLSTPEVETPETVAGRIREALRHIDAERLWIAPDCGMKYHSREHSQAKLKAMVDGAAIVRAELK
ncbi:MAG: 5-methyltetrahydropteroyltriglutamate--homocysteine methyltransferase [Alphaproteobacteria bacterium HGW-Alphaproteobacteria-13]|nr:MAG: 5-methyltetrahydropteroyltriglutamate--homocysteine methyltransferase [Alphaproteobacteria bacterium HGW-Alphaproteobacteria-13]